MEHYKKHKIIHNRSKSIIVDVGEINESLQQEQK